MKKEKINGIEHGYTDEEYQSIRENFQKAFGTSYGLIDATVYSLACKKESVIKKIIKTGDYFYHLMIDKQQANELGLKLGYVKILITYRRANVVFFTYPESIMPRKEFHFDFGSDFANSLIPTQIHFSRLSMLSKNRIIFQFNFSPKLSGTHIEVWDEKGNKLPDIIVGKDGKEIKDK